MNETKLITEHNSGDKVEAVLLVHESQLRTSRNGNLYISMTLGDKSGRMEAKKWEADRELFESFGSDDIVAVTGRIQEFKGDLQLIAESVIRQDPAGVDLSLLLPTTTHDVDEMFAAVEEHVRSIEDDKLRELMECILSDERIGKGLRSAPAAVRYHHAYLGGLLEHTLGICRIVEAVQPLYPELDGDLLMAGAILHDIGKIEELSYDRSFRYSDTGGLVGHTVIGAGIIGHMARQVDGFPGETLNMLRHMVLSHHGKFEFGAPVLPKTREAMVLHHIDNMDAKINAFGRIMAEDSNPEEKWTNWSRMFERRLYRRQEKDDVEAE